MLLGRKQISIPEKAKKNYFSRFSTFFFNLTLKLLQSPSPTSLFSLHEKNLEVSQKQNFLRSPLKPKKATFAEHSGDAPVC